MARIDGRANDQLRPIEIIPGINKFAEGSCLIRCGNTHVLCTASVEDRVPPHVPEGEGWVTAEYSMLPRANRERSKRDIAKLKLSARSAEIQRLVGRSLRAAVDMKALGPRTITVDCDVLQGDGGTRTASVTGGFVALSFALHKLVEEGVLETMPLKTCVAAISAGIVDDQLLLDLCYEEDSSAQVDLNCVMTGEGELVELQGTGEGRSFTLEEQRAWWSCAPRASGKCRRSRRPSWEVEPMKMVLASKNNHKLKEMQDILSAQGVEVVLESDVGADVDVEETGTTFEENALLKAKAVMEATGLPAIADDSGLCVDALGGAPGVYSARYGGPGLDDVGRGHGDRPGRVPGHPGLRAQGSGRLRVRPHLLCAGAEEDLCRAAARGEERHLPPGQRAGDFQGQAGGVPPGPSALSGRKRPFEQYYIKGGGGNIPPKYLWI